MAEFLAEGFAEDELYTFMFSGAKRKDEAVRRYFEAYIDFYGEAGSMVASSEDLECGGIVFYPLPGRSTLRRISDRGAGILGMLKVLEAVGPRMFKRVVSTTLNMSSEWIGSCLTGDCIHIDMLVTKSTCRGQGLASSLIKEVLGQADQARLPVTLETQNPRNVKLYSRLGFETVMKTEYKGLTEYCMIRSTGSIN